MTGRDTSVFGGIARCFIFFNSGVLSMWSGRSSKFLSMFVSVCNTVNGSDDGVHCEIPATGGDQVWIVWCSIVNMPFENAVGE